ncbi:hypothetical protein ACQKEN_13985 [Pseudomonas sp. NPDC078416]|uniref:hypothetical protein n=1 Tax=Pseudomonas sp. NPDC078416 TaxID=3390637 RepID=UPI003D008615
MFARGDVYNEWTQLPASDENYTEAAENGCQLEVRARANGDGVEVLVCVYAADGERVVEHMERLPGSEWTVEQGLERGRDHAERIAAGESADLPYADSVELDADWNSERS